MIDLAAKGRSRLLRDEKTCGQTHPNDSKPHSHYTSDSKAHRNKGRQRFKTGKKRQKRSK